MRSNASSRTPGIFPSRAETLKAHRAAVGAPREPSPPRASSFARGAYVFPRVPSARVTTTSSGMRPASGGNVHGARFRASSPAGEVCEEGVEGAREPTEGSFAESPPFTRAGEKKRPAGAATALFSSSRDKAPSAATAAESSEKMLAASSTPASEPARFAERGTASSTEGAFSRAASREARASRASACRPAATPLVYPRDAALSTLRSMRSRTPASAASTTRRICSAENEAPSSLRRKGGEGRGRKRRSEVHHSVRNASVRCGRRAA